MLGLVKVRIFLEKKTIKKLEIYFSEHYNFPNLYTFSFTLPRENLNKNEVKQNKKCLARFIIKYHFPMYTQTEKQEGIMKVVSVRLHTVFLRLNQFF